MHEKEIPKDGPLSSISHWRAVIMRYAKRAEIKEIERETEKGKNGLRSRD